MAQGAEDDSLASQSVMVQVLLEAAVTRKQAEAWSTGGPPPTAREEGALDARTDALMEITSVAALRALRLLNPPEKGLLQVQQELVEMIAPLVPCASAGAKNPRSAAQKALKQLTLEAADWVDHADSGKVSLTVNTETEESIERTARFAQVQTRKEYRSMLTELRREFDLLAVKPGTWKVRIFYVRWFCRLCLESRGVSPWRLSWRQGARLSATEHEFEETIMRDFRAEVEQRYGPSGCDAQACSHVRQWFLLILGIACPNFEVLRNDVRKSAARHKKHVASGGTKGRRGATRTQVLALVRYFLSQAEAESDFWLEQEWRVLAVLVSFGWFHRFRLGELARGGEFDPTLHWTVLWLAPLLDVLLGAYALVEQQERKVLNENTTGDGSEMVFFFEDIEINPVKLYMGLRAHDADAPDNHSAFRVGPSGKPPSSKDVCARIEEASRLLFPVDMLRLALSNHCFRIGGETASKTCMQMAEASMGGTGKAVANKAMGMVPGSASLPRYQRDTIQGQIASMHLMGQADVDQVADVAAGEAATDKTRPPAVIARRPKVPPATVRERSVADLFAPVRKGKALTSVAAHHRQPATTDDLVQDHGRIAAAFLGGMPPPNAAGRDLRGRDERRASASFTQEWQTQAAAAQKVKTDSAAQARARARQVLAQTQLPHGPCQWDGFDWKKLQRIDQPTICRRYQFREIHCLDVGVCPYQKGHFCAFCGAVGGWGHAAIDCKKSPFAPRAKEYCQLVHKFVQKVGPVQGPEDAAVWWATLEEDAEMGE